MKKFIILTVVIGLFTLLGSNTTLYALSDRTLSKDKFDLYYKQSRSIDEYKNFRMHETDLPNIDSQYAGAYFSNGELVINVKQGYLHKDTMRMYLSEQTVINEVRYSLVELEKAKEKLNQLFMSKQIKSLVIDIKNNQLNVELFKDTIEMRQEVISLSGINNIHFENILGLESISTATTVYNGTGLAFKDNNGVVANQVTVGFAAYRNGQAGIVTAGHIEDDWTVNDDAYYNNRVDGEIKAQQNSGDVDASFIELRDEWYRFYKYNPTTEIKVDGSVIGTYYRLEDDYREVSQGLIAHGYFMVSGDSGGVILNVGVDHWVGSTYYTDQVETNVVAIPGDSGGPLAYYYYPVGEPFHILVVYGIQSNSALNAAHEWVPGVSTSCSSTTWHILDELDLSEY
jgi:hypothetical protein